MIFLKTLIQIVNLQRAIMSLSVRPNYHLVVAKAIAQAHILIGIVQRGNCCCTGLAMRRMRALTARFKSLFCHVLWSLKLVTAFSLHLNFLTPRMRVATSALPTTQGSEPIMVSVFSHF